MIRVVTNVVLMISDLDILFSILFAYQVSQLTGIFQWGWLVHVVGLITYFAGVLYFAPMAKFKVVAMLKDMMSKHPEEFQSPQAKKVGGEQTGTVKISSHVVPGDSPPAGTPTFSDLKNEPEHFEVARNAMGAYNLIHTWNYCEAKNAKNTCERKHGVPFFRLARFGFVAEPSPKDLGSILNANALYTFCTGTFQLVYGLILMFALNQFQIEVMLPLAISGVSMLLTVANVVMDFPGVLALIDGERRVKEQVLQSSESARVKAKKQAEAEREKANKTIDEKYPTMGAADLVDKSKAKADAMTQYQLVIQEIERDNLNLLSMELGNYRTRVKRLQQVDRGRSVFKPSENGGNAVDEYNNRRKPLEAQAKRIEDDAIKKTNELDAVALSVEEFEKRLKDINEEKTLKLKAIQNMLDDLEMTSRGGKRPDPVSQNV